MKRIFKDDVFLNTMITLVVIIVISTVISLMYSCNHRTCDTTEYRIEIRYQEQMSDENIPEQEPDTVLWYNKKLYACYEIPVSNE